MQIRYIEYGKVFLTTSRGALEYTALDRSDNELIKKTKSFYLDEIATFNKKPDSQFFENSVNKKITIALIPWDDSNYLFMQLQQRGEDEFVGLSDTRETRRIFNQARFVFISRNEITSRLPNKVGLVSSLIYENPKYPGQKKLQDYIYPQHGKTFQKDIEEGKILPIPDDFNTEFLAGVVNTLFEGSRPNKEVKGIRLPRLTKSLFITSALDLDKKIHLFDIIQYWIYPALGVISFASDYVMNRQVSLFVCQEFYSTDQVDNDRVFDENTLRNIQFDGYFNAVSSLSKNELYHDTLIYYLRIDLTPKIAVTIFRLIETAFPFPIEEVIKIVEAYLAYIQDEHLEQIIQRRFNTQDQLLKLRDTLTRIPVKKRVLILGQILNKTNNNLVRYYPFHLSAMTGIDTGSQDATVIREFLRDSVIHCDSGVLDLIQEDDKKGLYQELILLDYKLAFDGKFITYNPYLQFATKSNNEINGQLMLKVLMERREDSFFESIRILFSTEVSTQLLNQITEGLQNGWGSWELGIVYKFWQIVPVKTADLYTLLLNYLLQNQESSSDLIENPLIFQAMLINGRDNLNKWSNQNRLHNNNIELIRSDQAQLPIRLLSLLEDNILFNLRKACLIVSRNLARNNVLFAYWWLIEELAYAKEDILIQDYLELIKFYKSNLFPGNTEVPKEALFLLSGGESKDELSIQSCIQIDGSQKLQAYLDSIFYITLANVWLDLELKIPSADIANLITRLPDATSDGILRKIILNKNKAQADEIKDLDPKVALDWLKNIKQSRVLSPKGEDILYKTLLDIKKPTVEFVRHMLIFESGIADSVSTWKEYSNKIKNIYHKKWRSSMPDSFVNNYIQLTSLLNSSFNINRYKELLMSMANINIAGPGKDINAEKSTVSALYVLEFIYENRDADDPFNQRICALLNTRSSDPELNDAIKDLDEKRIQFLYNYVIDHGEFLESRIKALIETEHKRRHHHNEIITNSNLSSKLSYTQRLETPTWKEDKSISGINDPAQSGRRYASLTDWLEAILIGILVLVVFVIFILIFIAINDRLFNEILNLLYGRR